MTKWLLGLAVLGLTAAAASAQGYGPNQGYPYPYAPAPTPGNFLPNYYNRQTQPLSPYLNLARGGNPGVNYFYGVRPGTTGAVGGTVTSVPFGYSQLRTGFIPETLDPDIEYVTADANATIPFIPSSAHPVVFGGGRAPVTGFTSGTRPGYAPSQMPATSGGTQPRRPTR